MLTGLIGLIFGIIIGFSIHFLFKKKKKPKPRVFRPAEEYHEPRRTRVVANLDLQTLEKELKRLQKDNGPI